MNRRGFLKSLVIAGPAVVLAPSLLFSEEKLRSLIWITDNIYMDPISKVFGSTGGPQISMRALYSRVVERMDYPDLMDIEMPIEPVTQEIFNTEYDLTEDLLKELHGGSIDYNGGNDRAVGVTMLGCANSSLIADARETRETQVFLDGAMVESWPYGVAPNCGMATGHLGSFVVKTRTNGHPTCSKLTVRGGIFADTISPTLPDYKEWVVRLKESWSTQEIVSAERDVLLCRHIFVVKELSDFKGNLHVAVIA